MSGPNGRAFLVDFGWNVYNARRDLEMTQDQLAKKVKVSRTSLSNIEGGQQWVTVRTLLRLSWALRVTPASLMSGPTL